MFNIDLIKKLSYAYGPAGNEEATREIILNEVKDHVDEVSVDTMGNLIAIKKGSGKKVMIAAHMDEIGIIITGIDDKGFLRFSNIGGVSPNVSLGQKVRFSNGTIGTVYMEHMEDMKHLKLEKMYIDIGAKDKEEALTKVNLGDVACFHSDLVDLGHSVMTKALDNRIGCYMAIETIKRLSDSPNELYFVFTVQEELGLRGAKTAAFAIEPDLAIALDITSCGDMPKCKHLAVNLHDGPAIKIKDNSILCHPIMKNLLINTAKENNIPHQLEVLTFGGTDVGAIHLSRSGVISGALSIACRYAHTPNEIVSKSDVNNGVELLTKVLSKEI
ncbi:MAG: M42 family metallopeptidase [Anaeromicrobium sp.]|jgi:endoglucanase|uniref:M42 family metallopeptidase n=1 Tax=Anaeromicrobium sp. TaxID=1929132 RepID=UPI0025E0DADC|nr:M42 family metallopeptidase [Anaeromicrobium sp.]MCT4593088.1 M42 family metallopeptidase [Anaeromicrobium sp.]